MKKFIAMMVLLLFSLTLGHTQEKNTYVTAHQKDTVTVKIVAENKKQLASTDNINVQLARLVENQSNLQMGLIEAFDSLSSAAIKLTREIEERNKSDGITIYDQLNFTPEYILKIIRIEKWIILISLSLLLLYGLYIKMDRGWNKLLPVNAISFKILFYLGLGILFYIVTLKLLTLIFNGDYYVIKELITLYQ